MLTVAQAAKIFGVSRVTFYDWLKQGLPYYKIRHGLTDKIRVDEQIVKDWVEKMREERRDKYAVSVDR